MTPSQTHENRKKELNEKDIPPMVKSATKGKPNGKAGRGTVKYINNKPNIKWEYKVITVKK